MDRIVEFSEVDYISRQRIINKICEKYKFIKKGIIGKSVFGSDITALKIGSGESYNLIAAAFHGSERITSVILLRFIEEFCCSLENNEYICGFNANVVLKNKGIIFVPCVNPDGCDISLLGEKAICKNIIDYKKLSKGNYHKWNANARGVDINHNFDADWENLRLKERELGIYGPAMSRFGGNKPHSEPETLALVNLCQNIKINQVTALHSQGEVIYWDYKGIEVPKARSKAQILATAASYKLSEPEPIATGGGFKDWFIKEFKRPGFTIELGKGENPLPIHLSEQIYDKVKQMLTLSAII